MDLTESDLAVMAKGSYYNTDVARDLARTIHPDWDVDTELSNKHTTTFHNSKKKHTVVAFRGTSEKADLGTDAMLFLNMGGRTKRYRDANDHTRKVIEKYGKNNLELTGHSLAGSIASDVSKKQDLKATTYNKGRSLLPSRNAPKEKALRIAGDPISGLSVLPSALSAPALLIGRGKRPKKLNPHSLDNFIN